MKDKPKMLCPCCKKELVQGKNLPLETLVEHVFSPNEKPCLKLSFHCENKNCAASHPEILWSEGGERFGFVVGIQWIDDNDSPFETLGRKLSVEYRKCDENKVLFTIPFWPFKGLSLMKSYTYTSNENGEILSRKRKFEWVLYLKWNKNKH